MRHHFSCRRESTSFKERYQHMSSFVAKSYRVERADAQPTSFVKADPGYSVFRVKWEAAKGPGEHEERELEMHPVVAFSFSLDDGTSNQPPWVKPTYVSKPVTALQGLKPTSPTARYWDVGLLTPDGHVFCYECREEPFYGQVFPKVLYEYVAGSVLDVKSFVQIFDNTYSGDETFENTPLQTIYTVSDQVKKFLEPEYCITPLQSIAPIAPVGSLASPVPLSPNKLQKRGREGWPKEKSNNKNSAPPNAGTEKRNRGGARTGAGRPKKSADNLFEGV